ncbi:MAG TPA: ABC transporter permease, partial [Acidimicrobiales bacterium]|nr:ABC transporter permease [Acidimicrobiales bacterium]
MFKATLKSIVAHKLRLALTALAVVLGVAFMSGTFVLTDTIKHTFNQLFQQTSAGIDAVVRGVAPYGTGGAGPDSGNGNRPLTPASLIDSVRSASGVAAADGSVSGTVTALNKHGKTFTRFAPTLAFSWFTDRQLSALHLTAGHAPAGPDEVTVDRGTANKEHFIVGDRITVIGERGLHQFTIVGLTKFG